MYEKLDSLIIESIKKKGGVTLSDFNHGLVYVETCRIARETGRFHHIIIGGRMQLLRKRNLIRYVRGKWRVF